MRRGGRWARLWVAASASVPAAASITRRRRPLATASLSRSEAGTGALAESGFFRDIAGSTLLHFAASE
jgi:hypothetical protein